MPQSFVPVFTDPRFAESSWFMEVLAGINAVASRGKFAVQCYTSQPSEEEISHMPLWTILAGGSYECLSGTVEFLSAHRRHIVLAGVDSDLFNEPVSCVTLNRRAETERLVSYLQGCGRNRIALFGFQPRSVNDTIRYRAALIAAASGGYPITEAAVFFAEKSVHDCFSRFLANAGSFDAVICPNDIVAVYFIGAAKANGIAVPDEIFVTGFSNLAIGQHSNPPLTTIAMDLFGIGVNAFQAWHFQSKNVKCFRGEGEVVSQLKMEVPAKLIVRESTDLIPEISALPAHVAASDPAEDAFYGDADIQAILRLNSCFAQRDSIDLQIMEGLLSGSSYESLAERYFLSVSSVRYRAHKIYADAGAHSKSEFLSKLAYLGRSPLG